MSMIVDKGLIRYTSNGVECVFDLANGQLKSVSNGKMELASGGLFVDVGADGEFALGRLKHHSLDPLRTWELPPIAPQQEAEHKPWRFAGYNENLRELQMYYKIAELEITVRYTVNAGTLEVSASVKNVSGKKTLINGIAFLFNRAKGGEVEFHFPGNVPHQEFRSSELKPHSPVVTGLVNPLIHTVSDDGNHLNLLFIDQEEKWSTGVYRNGSDGLTLANVAGVEAYLAPHESLDCGMLYLQLIGQHDPYAPVRELYRRHGWNPPTDGYTDGVLYSCHPHGTMDSGFPERRTMREYAEELEALKEMGIDHVWVLPIFEHLDRGVYHPTDQKIIDPRYGTDEDVKYFSEKLHEYGMTLMFDYVPHGPELEDPLGREHREWASVDRDGKPKIEWNCLSFDMTNPDYRQYTTEMVIEHVERFDIDGSRIDCAMGGLSNWNPVRGNRPSSSSLRGGVSISKAIRDGITAKGKKPIVTPENFNPVPVYAPYTDIFYDMPLYRTIFELESAGLDPAEYAGRLTRWLHAEMMSTPEKYIKLRFLGNHDSVTWVWQKARATSVYGTEKAKALWVLISCIDGIPMIYQGDEDAAIYKKEGPVLRNFFKELFAARKKWLGNDYDVTYLFTGTPIVAFIRERGDESRLVAVNLSAQAEACTVECSLGATLFGERQNEGGRISLSGYGYAIVDLKKNF
jgi:hypothetical protein